MPIKFEDVQAVDDKYSRKAETCKNFNQREMTNRQNEVGLWFFQTALGIIATNTNAKFQVHQTGHDKFMLRTKNYSKELSNSRANNSSYSGLITPIMACAWACMQTYDYVDACTVVRCAY